VEWPGRAINQAKLQLSAKRKGADPETRPLQQLVERRQALLEPLPEAGLVGLVECLTVDARSHG
jgi:hypothetical protein